MAVTDENKDTTNKTTNTGNQNNGNNNTNNNNLKSNSQEMIGKHCICCYKDQRNYNRFNQLVQSIIQTTVNLLKVISLSLDAGPDPSHDADDHDCQHPSNCDNSLDISVCKSDSKQSTDDKSDDNHLVITGDENCIESNCKSFKDYFNDWTTEDRERLFHLASKAFHITFPLYVAQKHTVNSRGDSPSPKEVQSISAYCELTELDLPLYMLRNIVYFCDADGIGLFVECFAKGTPGRRLPLSLAHAMIAVIANLKPLINSNVIQQKLVSLRTFVIEYLCKVADKELRIMNNRTMFEFIWSVVKEHIDLRNGSADKEGLTLALKRRLLPTIAVQFIKVSIRTITIRHIYFCQISV
ncbi:unnamed protein product [Medioppia subpectinata]|uniref:Uncharacterized protein n=1 Tax=Medioppia subpectinata TaxID=1979941 RepID=A0A7R9PTV2_9ACAR|nr:unnamed protein product [Medioppia subpectinata]CAG2100837.1 unnamed protein product [Medioppia subpectinata]